jgi:dTDP-4-dehydrorhamnose reductase
MRILVTGARGRLGSKLVALLRAAGDAVIETDIDTLDIADFAAVRRFVGEASPDLVIHCAAWTDVDGCARDPERAISINGHGTGNVAVAAHDLGAALAYISTNEVFDGRARRPYREYDLAAPINPYGYSKWAGERAVMTLNPRHYVIRTAWLFAHGGKNFIQTVLSAARAGKPLRVVTDEVANPTYNDDLAEAVVALVRTGRYGVYHLVNEGACSRYAFARYALDRAGLAEVALTPISHHQWPRASTPPGYAALDNSAARALGITLRPWQAAVDAFLAAEGEG